MIKNIYILSVVSILISILFSSHVVADPSEKFSQIQIFVPDKATLDSIWSCGIDFEGSSGDIGGMMEFVTGPFERRQLSLKGISYRVVIDDLAKYSEQKLVRGRFNALGFGYGSMGGFYTFDEVVAQLDSMKLLYPTLITEKEVIGSSNEDRIIWAVKISDNPDVAESDEPEVLYTALHHAREPQGMMTIIYYMWWLLENYGTNPQATYLVDNRQMWFVPVVNPDGYVHNQSTNPNGGGFWRKNRRDNGDGTYGVDPNRNYGPYTMWNASNGGSSTSTGSETYRGTTPFSEPENQAIDSLMRKHNFKTCFNYHTYGNYLIYPWGYLSRESEDSLIYRDLTYDMTFVNHYTNGTDQQTVGYSTRGNSDDYMFGDTTKPSTYALTPEVGRTGFWPSTSEIFPLAIENLQPNKLLSYFAGHYPEVQHFEIQDSNNNGFIERSESFSLNTVIRNRGLGAARNLSITASTNTPYVLFSPTSILFDSVLAVSEVEANFSAHTMGNAPIGVPFKVFLTFSDPQGFEKRDTLDLYLGFPTVVFSDSASAGTANWNVGTGWGITSDAHSVPDAFADSPSGSYLANSNNSLTTLSDIDLTGFHYSQLRYWTKWSIEPTKDFALVEISTNSGSSWTSLRSKLSHSSSGTGGQSPAGIWGYESYTPGLTWVEQQIDLSSYVDKQVKLRFRVIADGRNQRDGFYVDDIRLLGYTTTLVAPTLVLPFNAATNQPLLLMVKWNATGGASSYRLQVSTDSTFTTLILDDSTITDTVKHLSSLSDSTTYYWRVSARNTNGSSDWSSPVWSFRTGTGTFALSVFDRWNMISVPLSVADPAKETLFPTALSAAFAYQLGIGYVEHDSLRNNAGYWIKFYGDQQVGMTGFDRLHDTVTVVEGWNLIGSLSSTIPANTIEQLPADIVQSNFFTYQNGYVFKDSLEPGKGYWVKVSQSGKLILSAHSNINIVATHNKKPAGRSVLGQFNRLIITDHAGSSMVLYFTDQMVDEVNDRDYELPPTPPKEIFDVRFETQRMISLFSSMEPQLQEVKILLQSNLYPIKVNWEFVGKRDTRYEIMDEQNGKFLQTQALENNGGITIANPSITSLILRRQTEVQKPTIFSLEQNYPNPFNPQTSIKFNLPTSSLVTIKLYDLLGQEIQTIVRRQYQSGTHTINFDGADLQSGVYLYKLIANPENEEKSMQFMRKMVYLK